MCSDTFLTFKIALEIPGYLFIERRIKMTIKYTKLKPLKKYLLQLCMQLFSFTTFSFYVANINLFVRVLRVIFLSLLNYLYVLLS